MSDLPSGPVSRVDVSVVKRWLLKNVTTRWFGNLLGGIGLAFASLPVLFLTWGVVWITCRILSGFAGIESKSGVIVASLIGMGILFWGYFTTDRDYLESYSVRTMGGLPVTFCLPGIGSESSIRWMRLSAHSLTKLITSCLYLGPQFSHSAWRMVMRSMRLRKLDADNCSRVISSLLAHQKKVTYEELVFLFPEIQHANIVKQLRDIEGVTFLRSDPPGLTLTDDLMGNLRKAGA